MVWSACPPPRRACRRSRSQRLEPPFPYAPQRVEAARTDQSLWLHELHKRVGLRRHPWHCGTCLLWPTGDRRDAHRPYSTFLIGTGPLRHPLALGRHDGARGRSTSVRARAVGMFYGGITRGVNEAKCGRAESAPPQGTTRQSSTRGCSLRARSGYLPREDHT